MNNDTLRRVSDFEVILQTLSERNVRYLVVGGVAVVLQGYQRLTADLDLIIALDEANVALALGALATLDFKPRAPVRAADFANAEIRESWIHDKGLTVFSMWSSRLVSTEVDLFAESPIPFDEAYARSSVLVIGSSRVHYASIGDLIELKRVAGRPKDLLDIEELTRIQKQRSGQ